MDLDGHGSGEKLIRMALKAAASREREIPEQGPEELDDALSFFPRELRCVLRLPHDLRHCFVLRVLARLPRDFCAFLLNLEIRQVDEAAGLAAATLAGISEHEWQEQVCST